jgi:hypothetical protein
MFGNNVNKLKAHVKKKKQNKFGECPLQIGIEAAVFPSAIQKHKD